MLTSSAVFANTNYARPGELPKLRPPHGELPPTFWEQNRGRVVSGSAAGLALLCGVIWLICRPRPGESLPPEVLAQRDLEALRQKPEDGVLLSRVSQILRRYVAAAFKLPPGEMTTADFCKAISAHERVGNELAVALADFLRACDLRKFAPPEPAPALGAVEQALQLVDKVETRRAAARGQTANKEIECTRTT